MERKSDEPSKFSENTDGYAHSESHKMDQLQKQLKALKEQLELRDQKIAELNKIIEDVKFKKGDEK